MTICVPLLVFTDLDGTLISHDNYSFAPALPALNALRRIGAGVVMASSKTAPEIAALQHELDLTSWPAIVENGAGLLETSTSQDTTAYAELREQLNTIPKWLRAQYRGFGDMTAEEIASTTGLAKDAAILAGQRAFSEPGLWSGTPQDLEQFLAALEEKGVHAREGGRFLTLSFGATKADRMAEIRARFNPRYTLALGDAPNDVEMLDAADYGVIVANPHRPPLPKLQGEREDRIIRTNLSGPSGWNLAVLDLIARLDLE